MISEIFSNGSFFVCNKRNLTPPFCIEEMYYKQGTLFMIVKILQNIRHCGFSIVCFTLWFSFRSMLINRYIKFWHKCTTHLHRTSYTGSRHTACFERSIWSFPPKLKVYSNHFILYLLWLNNAIILHIAEFVKWKKLYAKIILKIYVRQHFDYWSYIFI